MAYCTYLISRGFDFLLALISGIFCYLGLVELLEPPPKNPFLKPPNPSPAYFACFYFFFSILTDKSSTFLLIASIYFFWSSSSKKRGSGFA
jgi:hypothetical protein